MLEIARQAALNVLPYLLLLTVIITFHEFGHFLVARLCGVKVDRFALGFGRAIASYTTRSGMEWRLGWIPLGGYVKFAGDANAASAVPDKADLDDLRREIVAAEGARALSQYFHFKPLWQRALIAAAGPAANFVLAILFFSVLAFVLGTPWTAPRVGSVVAGSPAARAGFQPGDVVVDADGRTISSFEDMRDYTIVRAGEPIQFHVKRSGRVLALKVTPIRQTQTDPDTHLSRQIGLIGLGPSLRPDDHRIEHNDIPRALGEGARSTWQVLTITVHVLGKIITGQESFKLLNGPLGIAQATGAVANASTQGSAPFAVKMELLALNMLSVAGFVSVGIGFANLLPIPVLDGGHLLFYAYEAVARKPLGARVQEAGFRIGLALLAGLMLFATWNDLQKFAVFKNLGGPLS
jgi:regulator of sigma E protease